MVSLKHTNTAYKHNRCIKVPLNWQSIEHLRSILISHHIDYIHLILIVFNSHRCYACMHHCLYYVYRYEYVFNLEIVAMFAVRLMED
jgi:hypothetical protein